MLDGKIGANVLNILSTIETRDFVVHWKCFPSIISACADVASLPFIHHHIAIYYFTIRTSRADCSWHRI